MVLFDEDPVDLMSATTSKFRIAPDKDSLNRISESLHTLASARQSRLDQQTDVLSSLSRRLNNIKGQYDYEEERHDAGRHAAEMLKMDTEKFRIAKGVNDAEIETERLGGELAALKQQLETLEKEGVEGGARRSVQKQEDANILKLSFYRSLGIEVQQDAKTGEYNRAVIHNAGKGDVNVIDVDSSQAPGHYTKTLWDSI
ncbi:putative kinetochore protein spc24 [Fulvia fulva]|uniref:Kinetochore protein Spc24 n=1 Tax=Passalora fulva TaxID=5499 RepID=A0A9Q8P631_PASFU|nr:putative kinetochore protein spc24 [Fulvia fulva]KAK4631590.1 putative kinetochore protein spc24 [Fulvia fulva]KAK4633719.1 putative kinetochore protein spc24 [Fulvia fulva]UJO14623.1 putative kinetochore protein spc24 [Fulvia fulva]WPV10690.1 putative kinetochore protein spc24 [Fulvia fulva]WPV26640.1 putative kinetochore protein spc24 [Fulvia fulva]